MGFLNKLFGKKDNQQCKFCGSKIDHFGFTAGDVKTTGAIVTKGKSTIKSFNRMMRNTGGTCPNCRSICCARCYSDNQQKCPHCGAGIQF